MTGHFFVALTNGNTEPTLQIKLEGNEYNVLIDSGASISFINAKTVPTKCETFAFVGGKIFDLSVDAKILGFVRPHVKLTKNASFVETLIVLDDGHKMLQDIILSTDQLKKVAGKLNLS